MVTGHERSLRWGRFGPIAATAMLALAGTIAMSGLSGRAAADEPANAPLPEASPATLAARIREAMARYDDRGTFRVVFIETRDTNADRFEMNRGTPDEQKPISVSFRGRARYESDGTRWRAEYDSMMPSSGSTRMWPDRWTTGFDGARRYHWWASRNHFILGESSPFARNWSPRSVIWDYGEHLVRMLDDAGRGKVSIAIAQRVVDGTRCYVVESKSADGQWTDETVVSPRQGDLLIGLKWTYRGRTYLSHGVRGAREVAPGIWAPERIEEERTAVRGDGATRLQMRRRIQVVEYRPGRVPPADAFRIEVPFGVDVIDRPGGFAFRNDPWWPEVGAMLRGTFAWPPPDFAPLRTLGSDAERKLDGRPAPPLRIATWLNTKPMDLAALGGRVVLVEFGDVHDEYEHRYAPALRALYAAYHPAGLEVVSIHAPAADADEVRRFARDYRLPYPVVIDEGRPGSSGATAEAFAIRGRICAFLIDHEGKVHSVGEPTPDGGRVVETVVSLLKASGARDVKPVSPETPRLPDAAFQAAAPLFQAKVKEALEGDPAGKITGRIIDGSGDPVPDADVRATLQLTIMTLTSPGAYHLIPYGAPDARFAARSGADGRFELSGLCKGEYVVRVQAHGRARVERKVFIAPDLQPASVELVLAQGDAIAGQVRDPQGKPIANANITLTERQHFVDGVLQYIETADEIGARTGETGRFRLAGLREGRYPIVVKAAGFKDKELEAVPAGNEKVVVVLERSP